MNAKYWNMWEICPNKIVATNNPYVIHNKILSDF